MENFFMIKMSGFDELFETLNQINEAVSLLDGINIEAESEDELIQKLEVEFDRITSKWSSNKAVQDLLLETKRGIINKYLENNSDE